MIKIEFGLILILKEEMEDSSDEDYEQDLEAAVEVGKNNNKILEHPQSSESDGSDGVVDDDEILGSVGEDEV